MDDTPAPPSRSTRRQDRRTARRLVGRSLRALFVAAGLLTVAAVGAVVAVAAHVHVHWRLSAKNAVLLGAAAAAVVAVVFGILLLAARRRLQARLAQPITELAGMVDAAAGGDAPKGDLTIPAEVTQSAARLREMTDRLRRTDGAVTARDHELSDYLLGMQAVLDAAGEPTDSTSLSGVLERVAIAAVAIAGLPRAAIWLADRSRLFARYDSDRRDPLMPDLTPIDFADERIGRAARLGEPVLSPFADGMAPEAAIAGHVGAVAVPMTIGARTLGVIDVSGPSPTEMSEQRLHALRTLASYAAVAIETARLQVKVELLSRTDPVTGLANRRQLVADLRAEAGRSVRYLRPMTVVMAGVDRLDRFIEARSRADADEVLALLGRLLAAETRLTDTAYHCGDDTFVILTRETLQDGARAYATRLQDRIERQLSTRYPGSGLTVSFGIADLGPDDPGGDEIVTRAGVALEQARAAGGNQVVTNIAGDAAVPTDGGPTAVEVIPAAS